MLASLPITTERKIRDELLIESAISPEFLGTAVELIPEVDYDPVTKEVLSTPIHDTLGWKYRRFSHGIGTAWVGAKFINEDGTAWQVKIFNKPTNDGKTGAYMAPGGIGNRVFMPPIPPEIRKRIGDRYGVEVPMEGSFWEWLRKTPQVPVIPTEGGKKTLSALSHGFVAIGLYGCRCGTAPELLKLRCTAQSRRAFYIALDRGDSKPKALRSIQKGYSTLANMLGSQAKTIDWNPIQGKGLDDLLASSGPEALEQAINEATPAWEFAQNLYLKQSLLDYAPTISVHIPELADAIKVDSLASQTMVAIRSPKGTSKTQFLIDYLRRAPKVLHVGHRVSLARAGARNFDLHFLNDLDRAHGMLFDSEKGQMAGTRMALCFDSLLSINPTDYAGGILVLDEADQSLAHLLTGSTCNKGGKRGALIARFKEILQVVGQVIMASADLTDKEIDYLVKLRDCGDQPWVLENTYHRNSYPCEFLDCGDDSAIIGKIYSAVADGQKIWVSSDQRSTLQRIARMLEPVATGDIVQINGKTSGSDDAKDFMAHPDDYLARSKAQVVLASPSVPTGLSVQRYPFDQVFGIFYGGALLTKECSQALSRVRPPVPRTVWAKRKGAAYNKISDSPRGFKVRDTLQRKVEASTKLLAPHISENHRGSLRDFDYETPTTKLYGEIAAERNFSTATFRESLYCRLKFEGNEVTRVESEGCSVTRSQMRAIAEQLKTEQAVAVVKAEQISDATARQWLNNDALSPEQQDSQYRHSICDWWVIDPDKLTADHVLRDRNGRTRTALSRLERFLLPELAIQRDINVIDRAFQWGNAAITPWDLTHHTAENFVLKAIGFEEFLSFALEGGTWTKEDDEVQAIADRVRRYARDIKTSLNLTVTEKMADTQIIGELLRRIGLKTQSTRERANDQRIYRYELDWLHLQEVKQTIVKRTERKGYSGGLPPLYSLFTEGVGQPDITTTIAKLASPVVVQMPEPEPEPRVVQLAIA